MRAKLENAFDFAQHQVQSLLAKYRSDYYPMYTVGGKYGLDQSDGHTGATASTPA